MSNVVPLRRPTRPRRAKGPCPEHLAPADLCRLLELAAADGFRLEEVVFAWEQTMDWWERCREPRAQWHLVCRNGLRSGWALRGFRQYALRKGITTMRELSPERIKRLVARQERRE